MSIQKRKLIQKISHFRLVQIYLFLTKYQFALDQLAIFKDALLAVKPKCMVVSNAFGSEIVREYLKPDLQWYEKRGFHWFVQGDVKVPMFFTSMLSGQRSLDRWSYERLVWHIKQAVK